MKSRQDAKYEKEIRDEIEKLKRKAIFIGVISTLIVLILSVDQYFIFSTKATGQDFYVSVKIYCSTF